MYNSTISAKNESYCTALHNQNLNQTGNFLGQTVETGHSDSTGSIPISSEKEPFCPSSIQAPLDSNISKSNTEIYFPKPTGSYSAGYKIIEFIDNLRIDPYNPEKLRILKVTVYYPSKMSAIHEPYGIEETLFWERALKNVEEITIEPLESVAKELNCIQVFKSKNADPETGTFPVILFEHGFGVTAGSYQHMILELVSHGYVVLAPSHPYIADTVIFEDENPAFLKADRDGLVFETAFLDAQFILRQIEHLAGIIPSMDVKKLGMIGHSLGGATTLRVGRLNPIIKAGITLDAPISHDTYDYEDDVTKIERLESNIVLDNGCDFEKPFLHVFAEKAICDHSKLHLKKDNFKAIIQGTEHNSFCDHAFLKDNISIFKSKGWNLGAGDSDASSHSVKINQLIQSFFDKFLKGIDIELSKLNHEIMEMKTAEEL